MSALHTIVEPIRPPSTYPPPHNFTSKPSCTTPISSGFTPFKPHIIQQEKEEEDVDILDDEDEDDLDGEEDGDLDGTHVDYQHVYPAASSNQSTRPPQQGIPLPTNNYLSISHIISPNTPHTLSQPLPAEKMREATQASTSSTSTNAPSNTFKPTQQKQDNVKKDVHVENEDSLDLFKENRHLRKKVEGLMGHNMQLMLGIKERDHKIFNQKRLLLKYRKALLRFFEENDTSSSSDDELANMSPNESKVANKKDSRLDAHLRNVEITNQNLPWPSTPAPFALFPTPPTSTPTSSTSSTPNSAPSSTLSSTFTQLPTITRTPSPLSNPPVTSHSVTSPDFPSSPLSSFPSPSSAYQESEDKDDESLFGDLEFDVSKKRKNNGGGGEFGELEPDRKRRGPRRNALWTPEDDEMFQKVYNVYGKSWKTIHNYLPGKTREQVQSHGQYLIRIGKLEDVKTVPRRGRKAKRDKDHSSSPSSSSSSSMVPHSSHHQSTSSYSPSHHSRHSSHPPQSFHSPHSSHSSHLQSPPNHTYQSPPIPSTSYPPPPLSLPPPSISLPPSLPLPPFSHHQPHQMHQGSLLM